MDKAARTLKLVQLGIAAFVVLLLGAIVFRDFVFGDKLLLYTNIGDDSTNFYYPYLLLFSRYLRTDGLPMWSFNVGMGQNIFSNVEDLLFNPSIWFPPPAIAHLLVYQHLAHALVGGLFFYAFLTLRRVNFCASLLGGLLFSYSAFMSMGSCWLILGNEATCIAFLLFAAELALRGGRWLYLALAVALFALLSAFHVYLCAILLTGYLLTRRYLSPGITPALPIRRVLQFAAIALLGLGLAAVVWLDSAEAIYHSPRGAGSQSLTRQLLSSGVFHLESARHYFTAILRTYSNDMAGTGDDFRGWGNYLEAPSGYAGLLPLLLLPQAFVGASRRRRLTYAFLLAAIFLTVLLPWSRYLFWLFQGDYYRTLSFYSSITIAALSMCALSRYFEKAILNVWLLLGSLVVLVSVLYLPFPEMQKLIDPNLRLIAVILLVSYSAILCLGKVLKKEPLGGWLVLLLTAAELGYFSSITVGRAPTVTKHNLRERVGYNDLSLEALQDIKSSDQGFYRIGKLYTSSPAEHPSLNDAVVFDFHGTASYHSFNSIHYTNFLIALEAIAPQAKESDTRWSPGSLGRPVLSTFLAEKYVLDNEDYVSEGSIRYEEISRHENIRAYRNSSFLPIGLFFDRLIPEGIFRQLSGAGKEALLLQAVVLDDHAVELRDMPLPDLDDVLTMVETKPLASLITARRESAFRLDRFNQNQIEGKISCLTNGFLVFQTPFDEGWHIMVDGAQAVTRRVDIGLLGVPLTIGEHKVALRYYPPFFKPGLVITGVSLLVLLLAAWRWPRLLTSESPQRQSKGESVPVSG